MIIFIIIQFYQFYQLIMEMTIDRILYVTIMCRMNGLYSLWMFVMTRSNEDELSLSLPLSPSVVAINKTPIVHPINELNQW